MDRAGALQEYRDAVQERRAEFRKDMAAYLAGQGDELEDVVRTAMKLVGEQMAETGKEYVCTLCISLLKTDLISGRYRFMCHGLDMRWYLDDEPVEVYVEDRELLAPLRQLWGVLEQERQGYGGAVNVYDARNLLFEELPYIDATICSILRWRLRDWEEKGIFDSVPRSPYWMLKWGEYRDRTEILVQTDRVEKDATAWKTEVANAAHEPEALIFSYWYRGTCGGKDCKGLDMRFSTFEEALLDGVAFLECNLEGSRFRKSTLSRCCFDGSNLRGADFRGCSFEGTSFAGANLEAAVFPAESVPFLGIGAEQLQVILLDRGDKA